MNETIYQALMSRLRESCLFYVKGDALALGALVTLYSAIKLNPLYYGLTIGTFRHQLIIIGVMIALGLALESAITISQSCEDHSRNLIIANKLRKFYVLFILLQMFAAGFILSDLSVYLGNVLEFANSPIK